MALTRFEELEAWKKSRKLVTTVYALCERKMLKYDRGLREQIQRASVSVMSNIAEGFDSGSSKSFLRYLHYSMGSASEVQSLIYVLRDLELISASEFELLYQDLVEIKKILFGLINSINSKI